MGKITKYFHCITNPSDTVQVYLNEDDYITFEGIQSGDIAQVDLDRSQLKELIQDLQTLDANWENK